jgi:peptide/nickel transport system permease protein
MRGLPWTIGLLSVSVIISFSGGLVLGAFMGWTKREGKASRWTSFVFSIFMIVSRFPFYLLGMILVYLFTYLIFLFPYGGGVDLQAIPGTIEYIVSILQHATLPALSIVLVSLGGWAIEARGLMVNILGEDYLFLAKAKGLKERYIFRQYAMKNTILPILTDFAISLGSIASGAILVEIVFSYPGIGSLLYISVLSLDYPLIQAVSLLIIFGVMTAALLIDLVYPFLDPRIGEK